jgi:hypothetical protein
MSKPRGYVVSGWVQMIPVYRLGGIRYGGGVNLIQAFMCNVGTCRSDDKGENSSGGPTRVRVPRRNTGTDHAVVARKDGNASVAKGVDYPVGFRGQPVDGRNL